MKLSELDAAADGPAGGPDVVTDEPRAVMAYLDDLEVLIEEGYVQYARDTLEGIHETITKTMYVTQGQMRAVGNIDEGGQRRRQ